MSAAGVDDSAAVTRPWNDPEADFRRANNEAALGFYEALGLERQKVVTLVRFLREEPE